MELGNAENLAIISPARRSSAPDRVCQHSLSHPLRSYMSCHLKELLFSKQISLQSLEDALVEYALYRKNLRTK